MNKIVLYSEIPDLNAYTNVGRSSGSVRTNKGKMPLGVILQSNLKKKTETEICKELLPVPVLDLIGKQYFLIVFYEKNLKKDDDNIKFKKKFIFDSFQTAGVLSNDTRKKVCTLFECVFVDKSEPRIEIYFSFDKKELLDFYLSNFFDLI